VDNFDICIIRYTEPNYCILTGVIPYFCHLIDVSGPHRSSLLLVMGTAPSLNTYHFWIHAIFLFLHQLIYNSAMYNYAAIHKHNRRITPAVWQAAEVTLNCHKCSCNIFTMNRALKSNVSKYIWYCHNSFIIRLDLLPWIIELLDVAYRGGKFRILVHCNGVTSF
jgi:hypothetical protein